MRIVAISDVHAKWDKLIIPECDLLISAGDYSFIGEKSLVKSFHEWMSAQPAKHKISVQGNHEVWVERHWQDAKRMVEEIDPTIHFIDEGPLELEGHKIWCSAVTPWFHGWAWNRQPGDGIQKHWNRIPDNTEILITHGPAFGFLDQIDASKGTHHPLGQHLGCPGLVCRIANLTQLKLHVCGHIHGGYGIQTIPKSCVGTLTLVNASICNERYVPVNKPQVIDL